MKADSSDKRLDELVSRAISRDRPMFDFDKWKKSHQKEIEDFKSQTGQVSHSAPTHQIWRAIMKSKITRIAAAAVITVAVVIGAYQFFVSTESVAWAKLPDRVAQIRTCIFRGHSSITGYPSEKTAGKTEMEMFVSSEYGLRGDQYVGGKLLMTQYMLPAEKAMIAVMPDQKGYMRMLLTDEHVLKMQQQGAGDPREMVRQFLSGEYTKLGRAVIDGVEAEGIETKDPKIFAGMNGLARLWVDVHTNFPVRIEMEMQMEIEARPMQMSMVMDQFQWDVELDPAIFEPNIPSDYTLMAEVELPGTKDEGKVVQGLRLFAELTGGQYPKSLDNMMLMMKEAGEVLKRGMGGREPNKNSSPEEMQKMMGMMMSLQTPYMFYAELVKAGKDPAYYGDKITAKDPDTVLMRWKISDSEYRVIFGDLTTENVTAEQLAELEKAFSQ